jgi:hypothetical protein
MMSDGSSSAPLTAAQLATEVSQSAAWAADSASNAAASAVKTLQYSELAAGSVTAAQEAALTATAQASAAAGSAANALTSQSATAADTTQVQAVQAALQAQLSTFGAVWLGQQASDPTTDLNGNPLVSGAMYQNTTDNPPVIRIYTDGAWTDWDAAGEQASASAQLAATQAAGNASTSTTNATQAAASASAAATSATSAAASDTDAQTQAASAAASAVSATASATSATASASAAAASATDAAASDTDAQAQAATAVAAASQATASATAASGYSATATDQATFAGASATQAQTAATTATAQATIGAAVNSIYASTTAGLAGTTNGQYFFVPSTNANGSYDLWQNSSGTASGPVTTLPNLAAVTAMQTLVENGSVQLNAGAVYPLSAVVRDGTLSVSRSDVLNGILAIRVTGAKSVSVYRLSYYGNGVTINGEPNYEMLFDEYTYSSYSTDSISTHVPVVALGDIPATSIDTSTPIITRRFDSVTSPGVSFYVTYVPDAFTPGHPIDMTSVDTSACWSWIIDPSCYMLWPTTFPSLDSLRVNVGQEMPLFQQTRDGNTSSMITSFLNGLLDVKVFGAKPGMLYRLEWYGNGVTINGGVSYEMLFSEYNEADYSSASVANSTVVIGLGDIPATTLTSGAVGAISPEGILTRFFQGTRDSTISFVVTINTNAFTPGSSVVANTSNLAGYSYVIHPDNYTPPVAAPTPFGDLVYSFNTNSLKLAFRATPLYDIALSFGPGGPNEIYDLTGYQYAQHNGTAPSLSRGWSNVWTGGTDTIGPYYVSADNNSDASPTAAFTGGYHATAAGGATAEVQSVAFYADGAALTGTVSGSAKEIVVEQVISVQGWNTLVSGRYILTETRMVRFTRNGMQAIVSVSANENVHIQRYYGAQMVGSGFYSSVHFVNGIPTISGVAQPQGRYTIPSGGAEVDSGPYTSYPNVSMVSLRGVWGDFNSMLDINYGVATSRYLDAGQASAKWSSSSGNKAYWQLIFTANNAMTAGMALTQGSTIRWRAAWTWGSPLSASANVDTTMRYTDKGYDRIRAAFLAAGETPLNLLPFDQDRALTVVAGTAAGTVDSVSGPDETNANPTGYGDIEFTMQ